MKLSLTRLPLMMLLAASTAVACAAPSDGGDDAAQGGEEDLTSLTARARKLHFAGYVYVADGASDAEILPHGQGADAVGVRRASHRQRRRQQPRAQGRRREHVRQDAGVRSSTRRTPGRARPR